MNHVHHGHCAHALAHCATCDVAYCTKCSKQWGGYSIWYQPTTTTIPWTTTGGSTTVSAFAGHAH